MIHYFLWGSKYKVKNTTIRTRSFSSYVVHLKGFSPIMQTRLKEVGFGITLEDRLLQGKTWGSLMLVWMETSLVLIKWALRFFAGFCNFILWFNVLLMQTSMKNVFSWHKYRKFTRYYDQYANGLLTSCFLLQIFIANRKGYLVKTKWLKSYYSLVINFYSVNYWSK